MWLLLRTLGLGRVGERKGRGILCVVARRVGGRRERGKVQCSGGLLCWVGKERDVWFTFLTRVCVCVCVFVCVCVCDVVLRLSYIDTNRLSRLPRTRGARSFSLTGCREKTELMNSPILGRFAHQKNRNGPRFLRRNGRAFPHSWLQRSQCTTNPPPFCFPAHATQTQYMPASLFPPAPALRACPRGPRR